LGTIIEYSNKIIAIFNTFFQESCNIQDCDKLLKEYRLFIYFRILLDFQTLYDFPLVSSGNNLKTCWNDLISLELTSLVHYLQNIDELYNLKIDIVQMIDSNNHFSLGVNKLKELLDTNDAAGFTTGESSSKLIIQLWNSLEPSYFKIANVI
jgi:regulator of replication initiation timing